MSSLMHHFACVLVAIATGVAVASGGGDALSPPRFDAALVCFNGEADSSSNCRSSMAKIEGESRVVTGRLTCGFKGSVSEITWTYRGQKDGKDCYRVARTFPVGTEAARMTQADVEFDGKRQILFEDTFQCIVIESPPDDE